MRLPNESKSHLCIASISRQRRLTVASVFRDTEEKTATEVINFISAAGLTGKDKHKSHRYQRNNELQSLVGSFQLFDSRIISPHLPVGSEVTVLACMPRHWQPHTFANHRSYVSRNNR
jgi:hypothetical protein